MERGGLARWLLLGIGAFLLVMLFTKKCGKQEAEPQALQYDDLKAPALSQLPGEQLCDIWTPLFRAQLTTRGASLKHFELLSAKYRKNGSGIDLSTTPDLQAYRQLRTDWRNEAVAEQPNFKEDLWQVDYDLLDWRLESAAPHSCKFSYRSEKVALTKVIRATRRPYELEIRATIQNLAPRTLTHALNVYTQDWRTNEQIKGKMFRVSPYVTHVECISDAGQATRLAPDDFTAEKMRTEPGFARNALDSGSWYQAEGPPDLAGVSNAYFAHALIPITAPGAARCQLQIEMRGTSQDPNAGNFYRARLAYPQKELSPNASAEYVVLSYVGPKERDALAAAGGGHHKLSELIDLGFFSVIAKVLVSFLLFAYSIVPNWGVAIILLTITARLLLFPLSVPSIRNMIRMREIKPEIDALNEKFKDDPQQKGLAQMELWRKHKVNPFKGCLPQLASMPVWFALYTTLQTAVELYNIPFLWFPDLSQPDPYYILPFIIGGTSFLQQKLLPMAGGDPAQQKMMLYFMPGMFTVFMLFLPSGLGVYMFTNGVLGIIQQQVVEWHTRRSSSGGASGSREKELKIRVKAEEPATPARKGRRKRRGSGPGSAEPLSKSRPLLDKGKA